MDVQVAENEVKRRRNREKWVFGTSTVVSYFKYGGSSIQPHSVSTEIYSYKYTDLIAFLLANNGVDTTNEILYSWINSCDYKCPTESNLNTLKTFINHGLNIDCKDAYDNTALHCCSQFEFRYVCCLDTVKLLLEYQTDINARNCYGETPLITFVRNSSDLDTIRLLLEAGADVHCKDQYGNSALHISSGVYGGEPNVEVAKLLLDFKADINAKNKAGETVLIKYIQTTSGLDSLSFLLQSGADCNIKDIRGNSALHYSAIYVDNRRLQQVSFHVVKLLLKNYADVNLTNNYGEPPLVRFLQCMNVCNINIIKMLLNSGTNINCMYDNANEYNNMLDYCLHLKNIKYNYIAVKYLLLHDINIWNRYRPALRNQVGNFKRMESKITIFQDEVNRMKAYKYKEKLSLLDLCLETNKRHLGLYVSNCDLNINEVSSLFPHYFDVIKYKWNVGRKWATILFKIENILLCGHSGDTGKTVFLNPHCLTYVIKYLNDRDLVNFAAAAKLTKSRR